MVVKNVSPAQAQAIAKFHSDLEAFILEAYAECSAGVSAVNKFLLEHQERRVGLKHQAHCLNLNFALEVSRIQKSIVEKKKDELERRCQSREAI